VWMAAKKTAKKAAVRKSGKLSFSKRVDGAEVVQIEMTLATKRKLKAVVRHFNLSPEEIILAGLRECVWDEFQAGRPKEYEK
jgi:hypothetical protein